MSDTAANKQDDKALCKNDCGFFGSSATCGYCSQCFMVHMKKQKTSATAAAATASPPVVAVEASKDPKAVPATTPVVVVDGSATATTAAVVVAPSSSKKRQRQDEGSSASVDTDASVSGPASGSETRKCESTPPTTVGVPLRKKKKRAKGYKNMLAGIMKGAGRRSADDEREDLRRGLGGGTFEKVAKI